MNERVVRWTRHALRRLDEIGACIAHDRPEGAARAISRIVVATDSLAKNPGLGRQGRLPGTRELVLADIAYLIPYRVDRTQIEILTVLHAAPRWPSSS